MFIWYNLKGSHPYTIQNCANRIGLFMDSIKHLEVGTCGLIDVSNHMAALRTGRNPASISGLMVL